MLSGANGLKIVLYLFWLECLQTAKFAETHLRKRMNKMNVAELVELLPDSVKLDVIDFQPVEMKSGGVGTRVVLDRILTDAEKAQMLNSLREAQS